MVDWRKTEEQLFKGLMIASLLIVLGSLAAVFIVVVIRGAPALSLAMITQTPQGGYYLGKGGGILNAIAGSLYLAAGAIALAFLISLPIAWYLNQYAGRSKIAAFVRISLDVASGIPSLIYGAFVFIIMIGLHERVSLFWGIITVALFITPLLTRGLDEVMQTVSPKLKEASFMMGATRFETLWHVVLRQSLPGIVTAFLLALGRGIGDAASVLFTAGYTDQIPTSLGDAVATLPLAIFFQLGSPVPEVQARAYASGIILLAIVLALSLCSRILSQRFKKYVIK
ncbi:MAG: ABC transporter permease subunit [Methanoregulaceae archaeon]|nr:ABC transporter permease subunit [Methanoregulaceae archaeon]